MCKSSGVCVAARMFGTKMGGCLINADVCYDERGKASRKLESREGSRFIWKPVVYGLGTVGGRWKR